MSLPTPYEEIKTKAGSKETVRKALTIRAAEENKTRMMPPWSWLTIEKTSAVYHNAFINTDVRDDTFIFVVPPLTFPQLILLLIFFYVRTAKQDSSDAFGWLASLNCVSIH